MTLRIFCFVCLCFNASLAVAQPRLITPKDVLNPTAADETAVFQQFFKGKPSGSMILSRTTEGNLLTIKDHTVVPAFNVDETLQSRYDLSSGLLSALKAEGVFGKDALDAALTVAAGQLTGHIRKGEKRADLDQPLAAETFSRVGLFALLPLFPLQAGQKYQAKMLDGLDGKLYTIDIVVSDAPTNMADPPLLRVELNGHVARQAFFISEGRTQRIEVLDSAWHYERVADQDALKPAVPLK